MVAFSWVPVSTKAMLGHSAPIALSPRCFETPTHSSPKATAGDVQRSELPRTATTPVWALAGFQSSTVKKTTILGPVILRFTHKSSIPPKPKNQGHFQVWVWRDGCPPKKAYATDTWPCLRNPQLLISPLPANHAV